ncbi:hypothetical protein L7F22_048331 [Adiantum nelumboides]|nr:hypothetical protein [Adiantum nelumboides]
MKACVHELKDGDEGTSLSNHLNEFNTISSQLPAQKFVFEDSIKAMFLLVTLPKSWDTFHTTIDNFAPVGGLIVANVEGNLLTKEVNRKNLDPSRSNNVLVVCGRSNEKGKSNERASVFSHQQSMVPVSCRQPEAIAAHLALFLLHGSCLEERVGDWYPHSVRCPSPGRPSHRLRPPPPPPPPGAPPEAQRHDSRSGARPPGQQLRAAHQSLRLL